MKLDIPKYQDLDFDREIWKTLSTIRVIQDLYNKPQVSKKFLKCILILDTKNPFEKSVALTKESIREFDKKIDEHIEILTKHNLVEGDKELTIPEEHDTLLLYLIRHVYLHLKLPLDSFMFYERLIPQNEMNKGVYTNHDDSFTSLNRGMYVQRGLFIKTRIEDNVYSGLMELTNNFEDICNYLQDIQNELNVIGMNIEVLEPIPIKPIPLFPLFTEASNFRHTVEKNEYQSGTIEKPKEFLEKWYSEYLKAYNEISKQIPRITFADPYGDKPKHFVVLINKKFDSILTAEYISEKEDKAEVRVVDKIPFMEKLYEDIRELPDRKLLLRSSVKWREGILSTLPPPFYDALKNIGRRIQEFNKNARLPLFDADNITDNDLEKWIMSSLNAKRYLISKLNIADKYEKRWLSPISVKVTYSLDYPRPNWRRSGNLFVKYSMSNTDSIEVHKLERNEYKKEKSGSLEIDDKKELSWHSGDLLHYMMEVKGEHSITHF